MDANTLITKDGNSNQCRIWNDTIKTWLEKGSVTTTILNSNNN